MRYSDGYVPPVTQVGYGDCEPEDEDYETDKKTRSQAIKEYWAELRRESQSPMSNL